MIFVEGNIIVFSRSSTTYCGREIRHLLRSASVPHKVFDDGSFTTCNLLSVLQCFKKWFLVMGQIWFLDLLSDMVYFTYPNVHFVAGEARVSTLSPLVYAAVVTEGAALGTRDSLVLGVLQNIMGTGPSVKYGSGAAGSRLIQAAGGATSQPFAVSNTRIF